MKNYVTLLCFIVLFSCDNESFDTHDTEFLITSRSLVDTFDRLIFKFDYLYNDSNQIISLNHTTSGTYTDTTTYIYDDLGLDYIISSILPVEEVPYSLGYIKIIILENSNSFLKIQSTSFRLDGTEVLNSTHYSEVVLEGKLIKSQSNYNPIDSNFYFYERYDFEHDEQGRITRMIEFSQMYGFQIKITDYSLWEDNSQPSTIFNYPSRAISKYFPELYVSMKNPRNSNSSTDNTNTTIEYEYDSNGYTSLIKLYRYPPPSNTTNNDVITKTYQIEYIEAN